MSTESTLVCDGCSAILAAARTAAKAKADARKHGYRRVGGRDLCAACQEQTP